MLDISVSFLNISSKFVQTFVPSVNKLLHAWCMLFVTGWLHRQRRHI